ncbi:MAG TPA: glycosyltransferase family 2 protein [Candidatus Thermoplasmatota archaeon]
MLVPLALTLPWLGVMALVILRVRLPPELPPAAEAIEVLEGRGDGAPFVSVVIPARNEAVNIRTVLETVTRSEYPRFEVIVVDDRSEDATGELARRVARGRAERLEVVDGEPLPDGWLGKPWACAQGAARARGELLLFTDADTTHGPALLARSVAALHEDTADAVTVGGRQLMGSFWERVVQPHIFVLLLFRFRDAREPLPPRRWRDAIANGQYLMFGRETYEAIGGHEAVAGEVVEDLRLAQILVKRGFRLSMRMAEDELATRMYRGLGDLVRGWSKNMLVGAYQTVPRALRPLVAPVSLAVGAVQWLVPPAALVIAASVALTGGARAGGAGDAWVGGLLLWGSVVVGASVLLWAGITARMGAPARYGLLYPVGTMVGWLILVRSWARGRRVEWKGREYVVEVGD